MMKASKLYICNEMDPNDTNKVLLTIFILRLLKPAFYLHLL